MKILHQNIDLKNKSGTIDLIPESLDDIYTLYNLLDKNDYIKSLTTRKVLIDSKTTHKVTLLLEVKAETISVDLEAGFLFVKGRVTSMNEHVSLGAYHTIDIALNQRFKVGKKEWNELSIKSLRNVQKSAEILFVVVQQKEIVFCDTTQNFTQIRRRVEYKGKNFKAAVTYFESLNIEKYNLVIIASLYDARNEFKKAILVGKEMKKYEKKISVIKIDSEEQKITKLLENIMSDPCFNKKFMNIQFVEEIKEVNMFLRNVSESNLTVVGFGEVDEALEYGALKSLLITNEMFKSFDVEVRKRVEELCKTVKANGAGIFIVPIKHYSGEILQSMGGVCRNLKYNYRD